jgi:hypothetical protein
VELGKEEEWLEVRLGGIYSLERISKESSDDYWTVMETLTAFVRERARWKEPDQGVMESVARFYENTEGERTGQLRRKPPTDIAAVLTVISRRNKENQNNYEREREKGWRFDLEGRRSERRQPPPGASRRRRPPRRASRRRQPVWAIRADHRLCDCPTP